MINLRTNRLESSLDNISVTSRTPSATVSPSSDRFDLLARWTDLNNFTVLDVLWFVILSQLMLFGNEDDMNSEDEVE